MKVFFDTNVYVAEALLGGIASELVEAPFTFGGMLPPVSTCWTKLSAFWSPSSVLVNGLHN